MGIGAAEALFARGSTYYNGDTIDSNNLRGANILGQVRTFTDVNPSTGVVNSNLQVTCIALRNLSGGALLPKQVIALSNTVLGESAAALASATALFAIVDEYVPAAGVPANDIFWAVIKGPTTALFVTVSGAKAAGMLAVGPSSTSGKMDFTGLTPGNATVAQQNATYGTTAFTAGAIADAATEARIIINRNYYGQG